MRNLKRALSLALASVMLLGMMVIGTSAASNFTDADEIVNTEAAAVTEGLGIFAGADGKFLPEQPVTRAEMAAIIVKMLYGSSYNANPFKGIEKFSDVADYQGGWAEGYINLCASLKVLGGYGDGTFKPGKTVTTAEAVSMLLSALGLNKDLGEWPLGVIAKATEIKMFNTILPADAALTRDDLSVLVLNSLLYTETGASTGKYVVTGLGGNATAVDSAVEGVVFESRLEAITYMNAIKVGSNTPVLGTDYKVDAQTDNSGSLGDKVFGLSRNENGTDDFGRKANVYTASKVKNFKALTFATEQATYTYTNTVATDAALGLAKNTTFADGLKAIVDGKTGVGSAITAAAGIKALTANNAVVEVYANSANKITKVIQINTYADTYTVTAASGETKAYVTLTDATDMADSGKIVTDKLDKGGVVLYTKSWNTTSSKYDVVDYEQAASVSGKLTSYTQTGKYTVAGQVYTLSDGAVSGTDAAAITGSNGANIGKDKVFFLGANDTIVRVADPENAPSAIPTDYAYVLKANVVKTDVTNTWGGAATVNVTADVQVALSDGTIAVYGIALKKTTAEDATNNDHSFKIGTNTIMVYDASEDDHKTNADLSAALLTKLNSVYNYSVKDGKITLGTITTTGSQTEASAVLSGSVSAASGSTILAKDTKVTGNSKDILLTSATKFIFIKTETDMTKTKATVVTGPANLGTGVAVANVKGVVAAASAKHNADKVVYTANYVFVLADVPGASTAQELVYVTTDYTVSKKDEYTFTGYKADGTTIALKHNSATLDDGAGLYTYKSDGKLDEYKSTESGKAGTFTKLNDTMIKVGDNYYNVAANATIVTVAEGAKLEDGCTVTVIEKDNVVSTIFITAAKA